MRHQHVLPSIALGFAIVIAALGQGRASYISDDETLAPSIFEAGAINRDIVYETQLYCLALAVYFEGGSTYESEIGQRHIARVVVERAMANERQWGGSDICDVVFYKRHGVCQFSFACLPVARRTPRGGAAWRYSVSIAEDELEGRSNLEEHSIRYYMNPALSSAHNVCWFRKGLVPVVNAGSHQFFREPTDTELAQLARSHFSECQHSAQAHKSKTHFAKSTRHHRLAAKLKKTKKIRFARR